MNKRTLVIAILAGLAYGVVWRGAIAAARESLPVAVMSVAFLSCVPLALGFITIAQTWKEQQNPPGWLTAIFLPWIPTLLAMLVSILLAWEGFICVVFLTPLALLCSTLGGLAAHGLRKLRPARGVLPVFLVAILPLVAGPLEKRYASRVLEVRTVRTSIDVNTPPEKVWPLVARVSPIQSRELPPSWTRSIGFPAPVEATLSQEGVGAIRHATFAGGVRFIETVDGWEPPRRLAFSIKADAIPASTLDEHVTIGGPFFDVLRGEYRLEPLDGGARTRIHLRSTHRLSTTFNFYASLWSDAVLRDVQRSILKVLAQRAL